MIEVILSSALFGLLVTVFLGAYIYGQESAALAGNRARAALLAEEGLEAVRNMRDANFSNLASGTFGLSITGSVWSFSGTSDSQGIFTRQITIEKVGTKRVYATSTVTWPQTFGRTGTISIATEFSNWQATQPTAASNLVVNISAALVQGNNVTGITVRNVDSESVTISSMIVNWSGGPGSARITAISINNSSVWSGSGRSGDSLNVTDTAIAGQSAALPVILSFNRNMSGTSMTVTFTMSDGSSTTTPNFSI